jgi:hypothetical protein
MAGRGAQKAAHEARREKRDEEKVRLLRCGQENRDGAHARQLLASRLQTNDARLMRHEPALGGELLRVCSERRTIQSAMLAAQQ